MCVISEHTNTDTTTEESAVTLNITLCGLLSKAHQGGNTATEVVSNNLLLGVVN